MLTEQSKHHVLNVRNRFLCIEKESLAGTQSPTICVVTVSVASDGPNLVSRTHQCHSRKNQKIVALLWLMYPPSVSIHYHPLAPPLTAVNLHHLWYHTLVRWMLSQVPIFEWTIMCFQRVSGVGRNSWIIPHGLLTSRLDARTTPIFPDPARRFLVI